MKSKNCGLCPRGCKVDRYNNETGYCRQTANVKIARAALHFWEEPCISGESGSGTVFFSGCPLQCVYCQNEKIALGDVGREVSVERLAEIFFELKEKRAHNINLVTPTHFIPSIKEALTIAKEAGLDLPIVYNTSSYETVEALRQMDGLVDIYLADLKYITLETGFRYSNAADYFAAAAAAIGEMYRQVGEAVLDEGSGMMQKGLIVRHLVLPGNTEASMEIIKYLHETYHDSVYISIMNQYTPPRDMSPDFCARYPELCRKLSESEYDRVVDYAIDIGVENGFVQEGETALESFIPDFDYEGV